MTYNICYFIIYISEAFIFSFYCNRLYTKDLNQPIYYSSIVTLYLSLFLFSFLKNPYINILLFVLINFCIIFFIIKDKWSSALFHSIIIAVVMGLSELISYALFSIAPNDIFGEVLNVHKILILTIISKQLYFWILCLISHVFTINKETSNISTSESSLLSLVPILSTGIMLTFLSIQSISNLPKRINYFICFSVLAILIINILIFSLYEYRNIKNKELSEAQLLLQKENDSAEYYKMLLEQDENQKILIHDMKKHLNSIAILISENKTERATSYIEHLLNFSDFKRSAKLCNNDLLNAILGKYKKDCDLKQISFHTDIRNNSIDFLPDSELSALFCNLLDNAYEAACKTVDGFISLNVVYNETSNHTLITVENSCRINPLVNNSTVLRTIKQDTHKHGFGMKSIRKIVSKYKGDMSVYYDNEKTSFHTIIILKNIK